MCIRDRRVADQERLHLVAAVVEDVGAPVLVLALARIGMLAVSYTHLRAHETVLDLVCRLLLEKKKK